MKVLQTSALPLGYGAVFGADDEIRTRDLILTKDVRYHLCHISIERGETSSPKEGDCRAFARKGRRRAARLERITGFEPATSTLARSRSTK